MLQTSRSDNGSSSWVVRLIIINFIVFLIQIIFGNTLFKINGKVFHLESLFCLTPYLVINHFFIWQVFTYMFLHSTSLYLHILFNMYILWIFGVAIEEEWGPKGFLKYYLFTGVGAGLSILTLNYLRNIQGPTLGASGAVFGLMLAFGLLYPNAEILLFFILPLKAKYLVILYGSIEFFLLISSENSNISHIGHLGGIFFGLIYFLIFQRRYLFNKSKTDSVTEIIGEIKKKVEEIKDKSSKLHSIENVKLAQSIKLKIDKQGISSLSEIETKFLKELAQDSDESKVQNICEKEDYNQEDPYCLKCEYFNICLHRDTTGEDPLHPK